MRLDDITPEGFRPATSGLGPVPQHTVDALNGVMGMVGRLQPAKQIEARIHQYQWNHTYTGN